MCPKVALTVVFQVTLIGYEEMSFVLLLFSDTLANNNRVKMSNNRQVSADYQ